MQVHEANRSGRSAIAVHGRDAPDDGPPGPAGALAPELLAQDWWTDEAVLAAGIGVVDVPFVTVGAGVGSFVAADVLRIAGVPAADIVALGNIETPWQTYEYLTTVSQVPRPERLRSDSTGMPDNLWAFPSYAIGEARAERTLAPLLSVAVEPVLTDYWTPRAGTVFTALAREAERIGWAGMLQMGQVSLVRRRVGGGYFTIMAPARGPSSAQRIAYRSRFVHLAVGYPGLRFLPDLQDYRLHHGDAVHVVNAYEPHEHVYEQLQTRPGVVLVRGGGIVASRVLQRLMEDRWTLGAQTTIVQLFRTFVDGPNARFGRSRRPGTGGFAFQGFNWPKGAWGGQLKDLFESLEGAERAALYRQLGGTHTPRRKLWQQQMARAAQEGWYQVRQGIVENVAPSGDGRVEVLLSGDDGERAALSADFVIDCTGLEADLTEHRVLADLLDHGGAGRNPLGRLDVERTFEVRGTASGNGRLYAAGAITLGGYYAGVDSFLGLQYAALRMADDLAAVGFCHRIGTGRSIGQWWKRVTGAALP